MLFFFCLQMDFFYDLIGYGRYGRYGKDSSSIYKTASTISSIIDEEEDLIYFDKQIIIDFLKQKTELFNLILDNSLVKKNNDDIDYTLIKGCVQSGKSRIIYSLCLYLSCYIKSNIVIILRNFTHDYDQFLRGFQRFVMEFQDYIELNGVFDLEQPNIYYIGNIKRKKDNSLYNHEDMIQDMSNTSNVIVALANSEQLSKINDCIDLLCENNGKNYPLNVIIDEIDQIGYSQGDQFSPQLSYLIKNNTDSLFGISATLFEPLQSNTLGFTTKKIYYLKPSDKYKGIPDIHYHYIEKNDQDILNDQDLHKLLQDHRIHEPFQINHKESHPMILLIKTERLIAQQDKLMLSIKKRYKLDYTVITYNGTNCKLYSYHLKDKKIILPSCKKKGQYKDEMHCFNNTPLGYVLQYLKNNGGAFQYPRIIIIAYKLVGRGINIVSVDFEWHLTHMFYRPCLSTDVTTMIQSMRLCGNYNDNIKLQCYMPQKDYENMYKGYMLQEDIFSQLNKFDNEEEKQLKHWFTQKKFYGEKIPRCKLYKNKKFEGNITQKENEDQGMTMDIFNRYRCITKMLSTTIHKKDKEDDKKIDGVDIMKLNKWIKGTALVGKMIRFLLEQNEPINLNIFKDGVDYRGSDRQFISNIDNGKAIKSNLGRLWICKNNYNKIEINKNIIKYIK